MLTNFAEALANLGRDAAFRVANEARPESDYLFATLLPERPRTSYSVESGSMTVRAIMAGLAGMDSPYPPGSNIEVSTFLEKSAKIANEVNLPEAAIREIQAFLREAVMGGSTVDLSVEALNFLEKVIVQAHMDTFEWLRGQALVTGEIDWTFNEKNVAVDYGIPAAHLLTTRTGNDGYGGSASKFWDDVRAARRLLRHNLRAAIAHPDTIDEVMYNDVNSLEVLNQDNGTFTVRRLVGDNERATRDARDTITLIAYDLEGEVIDPSDPSGTQEVPFMPKGSILYIGRNQRSGYRVGEGSTEDPDNDLELGYTHIAPTVEGGGRPGRWADLSVPDNAPWSLRGRAVTNGLPVIEAPEKIVVASTELT